MLNICLVWPGSHWSILVVTLQSHDQLIIQDYKPGDILLSSSIIFLFSAHQAFPLVCCVILSKLLFFRDCPLGHLF